MMRLSGKVRKVDLVQLIRDRLRVEQSIIHVTRTSDGKTGMNWGVYGGVDTGLLVVYANLGLYYKIGAQNLIVRTVDSHRLADWLGDQVGNNLKDKDFIQEPMWEKLNPECKEEDVMKLSTLLIKSLVPGQSIIHVSNNRGGNVEQAWGVYGGVDEGLLIVDTTKGRLWYVLSSEDLVVRPVGALELARWLGEQVGDDLEDKDFIQEPMWEKPAARSVAEGVS